MQNAAAGLDQEPEVPPAINLWEQPQHAQQAAGNQTRELLIQTAVQNLSKTAYQHHKNKQTAQVVIDYALPELCRCILEFPDALASQRVETMLDRLFHDFKFVLFFPLSTVAVPSSYPEECAKVSLNTVLEL